MCRIKTVIQEGKTVDSFLPKSFIFSKEFQLLMQIKRKNNMYLRCL